MFPDDHSERLVGYGSPSFLAVGGFREVGTKVNYSFVFINHGSASHFSVPQSQISTESSLEMFAF